MFLKFSQPITQSRRPLNIQISLRVVEIGEGNLVKTSPCHTERPGAAYIPRMVGHIGGSRTRHAKFFDRMVIRAGVGLAVTSLLCRYGSVDRYTESGHCVVQRLEVAIRKD